MIAKDIVSLFGEFAEYREPFVGGGSVFLRTKMTQPDKKCWINDKYRDLYLFWSNAFSNNDALVNEIDLIKKTFTNGKELYDHIVQHAAEMDDLKRGAAFFVMNRISFSGVSFSGGFSQQSFDKRFTESSVDRVSKLKSISNITVTNEDYNVLLNAGGDNVMIYCDPPYLSATDSKLYGKSGDMHVSFDHEKFADDMKKCKHRWIASYDDCEAIRELFSFANIVEFDLSYGMRSGSGDCKVGKELLISNFPLER